MIYVAQCKICVGERRTGSNVFSDDTYFGQTVTEFRTRLNGHRSKFVIDEKCSYQQSALSQHCFDKHPDNMILSVFNVGIVKTCRASFLDREENRFVTKFRTALWGLNRMKISR